MRKLVCILIGFAFSTSIAGSLEVSNDCVSFSFPFLQSADSLGLDDQPYFNYQEINFIHTILAGQRSKFEFKNKKIAFIMGSTGQVIISKKDFFKKYKLDPVPGAVKPHVELIVLKDKEKIESGGYDAIISYCTFPLTYTLKKHILKKLKAQ